MPWLLLLAAALLVGVGAVFTFLSDDDEESGEQREQDAVPVSIEPVGTRSLTETVRGVGTLRAVETVELRPEIAGRLRAIHFQEGGAVEEGELLVELDDTKLGRQLDARQAAQRAAEVRAANAQRTLERRQQLAERGVVSPDELDRAQEELDSALAEQQRLEAEVALTEAQLADTRITAPFAGVISEQRVDRGAYVAVGDTLATLYRSDPVEIRFALPERFVGRVAVGQPVRVGVAADVERQFEGAVRFVSPVVDEATRTFRVRAQIPNPELELKPGAFATAVVSVGERVDRPVVSSESLVATRTGYRVYVVEDDRAQARDVRLGMREDGMVEILEGVGAGERVVRTGHLRLTDGDRVSVTDEAPPGEEGLAESPAAGLTERAGER